MDILILLAKSPGTVAASFESTNTKHGSNGVPTNSDAAASNLLPLVRPTEKRSITAKYGKWFQLDESAMRRIHPFINPKNTLTFMFPS